VKKRHFDINLKYFIIITGLAFLFTAPPAFAIDSYEIKYLENGNVIQKSIKGQSLKSSNSINGSESKILINAPTEKVWEVLDKKHNLPNIISMIEEVEVIESNPDNQKVKTSIKISKLLPKFHYVLSFDQSEKYRRMKFNKIDGCFKELFGSFEFIPHGNSTILGYRIYSDPGFKIPEVVCKALRSDADDIMRAIKNEAEK